MEAFVSVCLSGGSLYGGCVSVLLLRKTPVIFETIVTPGPTSSKLVEITSNLEYLTSR